MSRPGYWMREGIEIPITDMELSHVKHALRYVRKEIINLQTRPVDQFVRSRINYNMSKLVELGEEAQRRNLIPAGDVTTDQLLIIVAGWEDDWSHRRNRSWSRNSASPAQVSPASLTASAIRAADDYLSINTPPANTVRPFKKPPQIAMVKIEEEIARIVGLHIHSPLMMEIDRRLDIDL